MSQTFNWCLDKTRLDICDKQVFYINRLGDKFWYLNGKRHRENGPAVEYTNGVIFWYSNGKQCYFRGGYWKELKNNTRRALKYSKDVSL